MPRSRKTVTSLGAEEASVPSAGRKTWWLARWATMIPVGKRSATTPSEKKRDEASHPKPPEQHQEDGQEPGLDPTSRALRIVCSRSRCGRPSPDDIQRNGKQPKPEGIRHQLAALLREAQVAEDIERGPTEGEPPDEKRQAAKPEPGGIGGQRNDAEVLGFLLPSKGGSQ